MGEKGGNEVVEFCKDYIGFFRGKSGCLYCEIFNGGEEWLRFWWGMERKGVMVWG